jgi:hypothetical protein
LKVGLALTAVHIKYLKTKKGTREMTTFTTQDRQDAQRTPLTDEEVWEVINRTAWVGTEEEIRFKIARAVERAHGIGE